MRRLEQENEIPRRAATFVARGRGPVARFRSAAAERAAFPVRTLCGTVGASAADFHA